MSFDYKYMIKYIRINVCESYMNEKYLHVTVVYR